MNRYCRLPLALVSVAVAVVAVSAQPSDRAKALDDQITQIFAANTYQVPRFGPARWLPDGSSYTTVEESADGNGRDIIRYDAASGARSVLISSKQLVAPGTSQPMSIDNYVWSSDGKRLLIFTNSKKVWRDNTRGDYYVLDTADGKLHKLGGKGPESTLMFAKFSPDATKVAYVRGNNIFVEMIEEGHIRQITADGTDTTINGTSDWVYEEELGLRDAFRWSPDGANIAFWQFDATGVGTFTLINDTDTLYPETKKIAYPKVGTANSAVRIGVVNVESKKTRWMKTPGDPRDSYLARMEWMDGSTVGIQQLNRLQNQNDLLLADARTGEARRVFRDENKAWVDTQGITWIDSGKSFLCLSERDGWRKIYKVSRDGSQITPITLFDADVLELSGVNETAGWAYFIASPEKATERYLYRSKLDGTGTPERVTPAEQRGTHRYDVAPGGKLAFHTYSRFDQPPVVSVVSLPEHTALRTLTDTSALVAKLAPILKPEVEFFTIDVGDGVTLDGYMLKPSTFDPTKKYPVISHVYGEPASQTVMDQWGGSGILFHRALAEAGYIVLSVDNRGTPAPKGAAWRKVIYGAVGDLASKEQAAAMRALAAKYPFIDASRIGVWGWSGGGTNTLNAMFRFGDVYKVGVSVAPVPDQKLYDTIYQERYMGLPSTNADGYKLGSAINFADGLKGKLLIIHGSGDDNVHYQGTERLFNKLIELGKPFDVMVYPNRTHSISEGAGTSVHVYKRIARYFIENLSAGPQ
ncbi:MAG TPA: S9 family peptidase [Vicinamibacterales bacterium]|nr:S9 family peptidase [Vicinamibacterales bacterium]